MKAVLDLPMATDKLLECKGRNLVRIKTVHKHKGVRCAVFGAEIGHFFETEDENFEGSGFRGELTATLGPPCVEREDANHSRPTPNTKKKPIGPLKFQFSRNLLPACRAKGECFHRA